MRRVLTLFLALALCSALVHRTQPAEAQAAAEPRDVLVYFLDGEQLVVGGRRVQTVAVGTAAMEALLAGPSSGFETDLGLTTAIPAGTRLLGLTVAGGTATVDLSGEFESGGGTASVTARVAQVVFTLSQFSTVDEVDISIDGTPKAFITGQGYPAQDLSRADFLVPSLAKAPIPLILVESPFIGQTVSSRLTIAGLSNTFEATVRYQVTDPEGRIIVDRFTTATAGTGTWGTFSVTVDLPAVDRDGVASVIVFEDSPKDGSPINVVEVPVVLQGVASIPPIGFLDVAEGRAPSSIRVAGWTFDPQSPTATVAVHVYIDGTFATTIAADQNRPDVATAFPDAGARHGYDTTIPATPGTTPNVCVYAIDIGPGPNPLIACRRVDVPSGLPIGSLDVAEGRAPSSIRVAGWTFDPETPTATVAVHVYIDGTFATTIAADQNRPDVATAFPDAGARHGYDTTIPATPGTTPNVCVYAIDIGPGPNPLIACRRVDVPSGLPIGFLDVAAPLSTNSIRVAGWTFDPETPTATVTVHVYIDGTFATTIAADQNRPDVATAFPDAGARHGYDTTIPATPGTTPNVCVYAIDIGPGPNPLLGCRLV